MKWITDGWVYDVIQLLHIIIAGMVDFLLEFGYGGSLPSSLYEAFGGVLWGGFQVSAPASSSPRLNGGRLDLIA